MANVRTYQIVINGVQESIDAVENLNKQLNVLEEKIKALEALNSRLSSVADNIASITNTEVKTSPTSTENTRNIGDLDAEEKLRNQIVNLEDKIIAARNDEYQILLKQKQELKEIVTEQKAQTAEANLSQKAYANTMQGLKQELADIKAVMQTTDLGDEKFKDLVGRAGQLTEKLKEIEKQYGQFGRNVGNYASAAEGFKNFSIEVAGATQEFNSAKQALMELKKEMQTLSAKKDMGLISEEEAERLKSLIPTVKQLESSIQDAGKPMDSLMDTMQSVIAIAQTAKGLSAFFDVDETKFQQTIQKLVALQNVMQGIQTLEKQMQTGEGIGALFAGLDNFAAKAQNGTKAMQAMGKAANFASTAIKAVGKAFAWVQVALVAWDVIKGFFESTEEEADEANKKMKELANTMQEMKKTYVEAQMQNANLASRLSHLQAAYNSTNDELKKTSILKEAAKEFKNLGIQVNSLNQAQKVLVDKGQDVIDMIREQGKVAALSALRMEAFTKSFKMKMENGYDVESASILAGFNNLVQQFDEQIDKSNEKIAKYQKSLGITGDYSSAKNDSRVKAEEKIQELTLKLMKDGLAKKLRQLDEEKRQTLNKVKGTAQQKLDIEKKYDELRLKEIQNYLDSVKQKIDSSAKSISNIKLNINASQIETVLEKVNFDLEKLEKEVPRINNLLSTTEYNELLKERKISRQNLFSANIVKDQLSGETDTFLTDVLKEEIRFIEEYGYYTQNILEDTFTTRIEDQEEFYSKQIELFKGYIQDRKDLLKESADEELRQSQKAAHTEWEDNDKQLKATKKDLEDSISYLSSSTKTMSTAQETAYNNMLKNLDNVLQQIKENNENYARQIELNKKKHDQRYIEIDKETKDELKRLNNEYFETQLSNFRDFNSKLNQEMSKQPIFDKYGFGIINIVQTKKNFKEMESAILKSLKAITYEKTQLSEEFHNRLIDEKDYNAILNQLNDLEASAKDNLQSIKESLKSLGGEWWGTINEWIQQIGQAATSIMSSLSEITSNHYDELIDQQEKYIDKLEEMYDKQKELAEDYASAIDDIENELSNARGDRRQQLIDALNAEMAARRAALAQEKKIEKEKEKAEHKKADLEYDQAVARKKMDLAQAAINASMAVSMAAVNKWPIPAIPMMALAASVGAAQIAAVSSQYIPKPQYAQGGVIVGKSHREGGVPVLGGQAEVEGGEFITNKVTTSKNVELLEYINTKKKKLDISDLLEFYKSDKPSKGVASIKTKFADGGFIPQLRTDISFNDRLITAFEDYASKPTVVAVTDIINQSERLKEVQVISGLID